MGQYRVPLCPMIAFNSFVFCSVEVLPFDSELVHETLQEDFGEIYDDDDDSNGW